MMMLQQRKLTSLLNKILTNPTPNITPISISILSQGSPLLTLSTPTLTSDQLRIYALFAYSALDQEQKWTIVDFGRGVKCIISRFSPTGDTLSNGNDAHDAHDGQSSESTFYVVLFYHAGDDDDDGDGGDVADSVAKLKVDCLVEALKVGLRGYVGVDH
ncbi:uncharacterized protein LODBEIA_P60570 [Lodderomyces beijingensis]|uniref:Uncharacterized protein n=1 Tax=Lodderomyces beijingensis TaxID=1775926 RepID=A0ABP0ZUL4_9ASCO